MKVVCLLACLLGIVSAAVLPAPTLTEGTLPQETPSAEPQPEIYREKRSSYQQPYILPAPCAGASSPYAAASSPYAAFASAPAPYHNAPAPHAYAPPPQYGYPVPQYRDAADEQEMLSFSDMDFMQEHMPMARYGYAPAAAHYGGGIPIGGLGQLVAPAGSGPAIGVFPNANVGGCSVPLLLSCSPSIVPGKIVKTQTHPSGQLAYGGVAVASAGAAGDAYRGVDEPLHHHDMRQFHEAPEQSQETHEISSAHSPDVHQ